MELDVCAIVMDNGSGVTKTGFAGDNAPSQVFPSTISEARGLREKFVAQASKLLTTHYPIEHGIAKNWDELGKIWGFSFYNKLRVAPEEHPVLFAEAHFNPASHREMYTQIGFETYGLPAFYLANHSALAMCASGQLTGVAVSSGHGVTSVSPVYQGHTLRHSAERLDVAGHDLTEHMAKLVADRGYLLASDERHEVGADIKERLGYVCQDFERMESEYWKPEYSKLDRVYELPDGETVVLGPELFSCAEPLFRPALVSVQSPGLSELVARAIKRTPSTLQPTLWAHVQLSGGSTLFPGLTDRLQNELAILAPSNMKVTVVAPSERMHSVWIGGSILASLSTFQQMWISKEEYDEFGPAIVHRKCF